MSRAKGTLNRGGFRERLRQFFEANPDEELTRTDIMTKFEVPASTVDSALKFMSGKGELEPVHVWRRKRRGI
jgi:Fic family protein